MTTINDIKIVELLELICANLDLSSTISFYTATDMVLPDKYVESVNNAINSLKLVHDHSNNFLYFSYCNYCYKTSFNNKNKEDKDNQQHCVV